MSWAGWIDWISFLLICVRILGEVVQHSLAYIFPSSQKHILDVIWSYVMSCVHCHPCGRDGPKTVASKFPTQWPVFADRFWVNDVKSSFYFLSVHVVRIFISRLGGHHQITRLVPNSFLTLKAARWQDICADTGNQSFLQSRQRLKEMLNNGTIVLPDRWSPEPSQTLESIWVGRDKVMFKLRRTQRFRWSLGSKKILIQIHDSWLRLWLWLWLMTHD